MSIKDHEEIYQNRIKELEIEKADLEQIIEAYQALEGLSHKELKETNNLVSAYKKVHELSRKEMIELKKEIQDTKEIHSKIEKEIIDILDEDQGNEQYIIHKFNVLHQKSGDDFFVDLFKVLVNLEFTPEEASKNWKSIMDHKTLMSSRIGKEINFRVAMLDYFINENKKIKNPKIIEIKLYEKTVKFALIDELTGLFNRKYYEDIVEKELKRAKRYKRRLSMCVIDIDNFKTYNDNYGHICGDTILESFGKVVKSVLRSEDIICRYGGEEFVVIMPEITGTDAVNAIERVRREFSKIVFEDNKSVTFSTGIAVYPIDAENKEELFIKADKAMYSAKADGKDKICLYGHERRTKKRIPVDWSVSFSLLKQKNGKYYKTNVSSGKAMDISLEGICFNTDEKLSKGDFLQLIFDANNENPDLNKKAKVIWISEADNEDCAYKVGLKFLDS